MDLGLGAGERCSAGCIGTIEPTLMGWSRGADALQTTKGGPGGPPWSDVVIHCRAGYQTPPVGQPPSPPVVQPRVNAPGEPAVFVMENTLPVDDAAAMT